MAIENHIQRDISWLDFNYRVLQEAKDNRLPLLERLKFLAIYSSNLDEFFRVRVANHRNLMKIGKSTRKAVKANPEEVLKEIARILNSQQEEFTMIYQQITKELATIGIHILRRQELNSFQIKYIESYFNDHLRPHIQPILLVKDKIKPFLTNASIYLAVQLEDKLDPTAVDYAIVRMPSNEFERFIVLPSDNISKKFVIILDDVVRHCISWIFSGYNIVQSYSIKLTRDAELYISDEYSGDLLDKIRKSLNKRNVGETSRMVYDRNMPKSFLSILKLVFGVTDYDLYPEGRYHNNFDFFEFPNFNKTHLLNNTLEPLHIDYLEDDRIWESISEKDRFVNPPYHSYLSVINFFEKAAVDPLVTHIKITQYRVAKTSRIMNAIIKALKMGKQVTVFIEVKARFDEKANLEWGEILEKEGVQVFYSFPGIKVHAKLALVIRKEMGKDKTYAYIGTGNFHERTAKIYCDVGIFTTDKRITGECLKLFKILESRTLLPLNFEHLGIGMYNLNSVLIDCIDETIKATQRGAQAEMILKMNSLQDEEMIEKLYSASRNGVKIKLIVRGICCIVSGKKGLSESTDAMSIVDRYLEHSRIFIFKTDASTKYYISSADWMYRNLHKRIELLTPIYDSEIQQIIHDKINIQLNDNMKARSLNFKNVNKHCSDENELSIQSQIETYFYYKRLLTNDSIEEELIEAAE